MKLVRKEKEEKKLFISLPDWLHRELKVYCSQQQVTMKEVMNYIIEDYLDKERNLNI